MEATLEKDKIEIIKWIAGLKDRTAIDSIKLFKNNSKKSDKWVQISEEEQAALDGGLADIKAGRVKSHKVVKKIYEKWL